MEITAEMVKELRTRTGIGVMECKKALKETNGNIEEAITILRKRGYERAKDKMSREAAEGLIGSYVHLTGKIGVLVEVNCETDFVANMDEFKEITKNICLHIAASNPIYLSSDDVPDEVLEKEKEIIREQFKDSNKPQDIIEKIVEGKLNKFFQEVCLLEQAYIRDDKITIKQLLASFIAKCGENVQISRFCRFEIGQT